MQAPACMDHQTDPEDCIAVARLEFTDSRAQGYREPVDIFAKEICKIGRDSESKYRVHGWLLAKPQLTTSSNFVLSGDEEGLVSRNHCEIYAVKYDSGIHHIYVRDRGSCNGTYVNKISIASDSGMSSGYLLQDGDEIQVLPYWKFTLHQPESPPERELTQLQTEEVKEKYTLTNRCLGSGAEATVYLAIDMASKKQLVCKLVNLDNVKGRNVAEGIRRRRQEVDILRQLRHVGNKPPHAHGYMLTRSKPNILPYIDAIGSPHTLYTFTHLAAGGDLMSYIYRHDIISEFDTQIIMRQVVSGLEYLHSKGIVHRDLKPENILLANCPKIAYSRVMLSDFGASAVPRRNRMTTNVGTMRYQAPEFSNREQSQGPSVDMWSLGIVALLLLAPYGDRDYADLTSMEQQELEVSLKDEFFNTSSQCSPEAQKFVWECLRVQAAARLTASQAARHDWLNSSPAHLKFFEKFDRKVRASWNDSVELNAMPWDIPCVLSRLETRHADNKGNEESAYFPTPKEVVVSTVEDDEDGISLVKVIPDPINDGFTFQKPTLPAKTTVRSNPKPAPLTPKTSQSAPLQYGERARRRQSKRKRMSELNIRPDLKIHESMHLPLNTLAHKLPLTPFTKKRRQVLEELKQSKALFLQK